MAAQASQAASAAASAASSGQAAQSAIGTPIAAPTTVSSQIGVAAPMEAGSSLIDRVFGERGTMGGDTARSIGAVFGLGAAGAAAGAMGAGRAAGLTRTGQTNPGRIIGENLMLGVDEGLTMQIPTLEAKMVDGIWKVVDAGKKAAEIASPSRKAAREIGGPIMEGVGVGIMAGTGAVTSAMMSSIGFAFNSWKAGLFGGTFVGSGLNVVANPGGMLGGGLGGFLGMLGTSISNSFAIGQPTSGMMGSRVLMSNIPTGIRDMGQGLLSGALESFLPGWAAGPLADMVGTATGLKPVLQRDAITAPAMSADSGGFADYPYGGGTIFNINNNFNGNFTDVERQVQLGILQSARRLGVYI